MIRSLQVKNINIDKCFIICIMKSIDCNSSEQLFLKDEIYELDDGMTVFR